MSTRLVLPLVLTLASAPAFAGNYGENTGVGSPGWGGGKSSGGGQVGNFNPKAGPPAPPAQHWYDPVTEFLRSISEGAQTYPGGSAGQAPRGGANSGSGGGTAGCGCSNGVGRKSGPV